jgi:TPR repeat protein
MAPQTKLGPYAEAMAGESGLDEGGSELTSYGPHRPVEPEAELPPEDDIPLFLSSQDEEKAPRRIFTPWRILKAAALAAVGAATVFVILSRENPRDLFSSAKASLPAAPASQSSAVPSPPAVQLAGDSRTSSANAMVPPSRDEMAAALRAAHESMAPRPSQNEIRQPPAQAAPAAPPRRMDAGELATLLNRAKGLIAIGDIAPARLLLERAADAQEARAALLLAQTYDPAVLGTQDLRSITPDPAIARAWYQKAARLGSLDAQQRLAQMQD